MKVMQVQNFKKKLKMQLGFIRRSCDAFDQGHCEEAIRIAVSLRVLLHDTPRQISLLSHLEAKNICLLTTTKGLSKNSVGMAFGSVVLSPKFQGYIAPLDTSTYKDQITVENWLNQIIHAQDFETPITRKDIFLSAAEKDGGAHVDKSLDPKYSALSQPGFMGTISSKKLGLDLEKKIEDAHLVALRQMGYEILHSSELTNLINNQP